MARKPNWLELEITDFAAGRISGGLREALCATAREYWLEELSNSPQHLTDQELAELNTRNKISAYLCNLYATARAVQLCKDFYQDLELAA